MLEVINKFGKGVIKQARTNLTKKKKNASKQLYNSLDYKAKKTQRGFEIKFLMEDYGKFIDRGVKGVGGTKADGSKWKLKKVTNNNYKFRNKKPPVKVFNNWIVRKGLAPRENGKFASRKGLQYALATSVFHTGLETTDFFTRAFETQLNNLPNDIADQFIKDFEI